VRREFPLNVTALCLMPFTAVLGVTVVVASLPSMLASLHAPQSASSLIATGYAMCFGALLMMGRGPCWRRRSPSSAGGRPPRGRPLPPRQLTGRPAVRQGVLGGFLNTATTSSATTLLTLYLQNTRHRSPLQAAATLLPFSLAVIAGSAAVARLLRHTRPQWVVAAGLAVIAAAEAALIPSAARPWAVPLGAAGAGAGIGLWPRPG
jgi:predicted MFS family arabinose efflux permease